MEYRKESYTIYIRMDQGESVMETILQICEKEHVQGGYFQGIGACDRAVLDTYVPEKDAFVHHNLNGMLEMITLNGNISIDCAGTPVLHSHATFSFLNDEGVPVVMAGHLQEAQISFTGEIVLVKTESPIRRKHDPKVGIEVWDLR